MQHRVVHAGPYFVPTKLSAFHGEIGCRHCDTIRHVPLPRETEEVTHHLPIHDCTQSTVGKAGRDAFTAARVNAVRVLNLDYERVALRHNAEAGNQLSVGELVG